MRKVHDVLRLHFGLNMPQRQIARSIQVSQKYRQRVSDHFEQSGLSWPLPEGFDDTGCNRSCLVPVPASQRVLWHGRCPTWSRFATNWKREIEAKLILGSYYKGWIIAENLIAEKNVKHEPFEFGYAVGISRPLAGGETGAM